MKNIYSELILCTSLKVTWYLYIFIYIYIYLYDDVYLYKYWYVCMYIVSGSGQQAAVTKHRYSEPTNIVLLSFNMEEIIVDALPGVVSLFLLDASSIQNSKPCEDDVVHVLTPYGFNHRNVNLDAIMHSSTYQYSLQELYSNSNFDGIDDRMLSSIKDNLTTPLLVVPFSTFVDNSYHVKDKIIDVIDNKEYPNLGTWPPSINVDSTKRVKSKTNSILEQGITTGKL